jgi:glycosyltransferase involved in cell wall biosynthesis
MLISIDLDLLLARDQGSLTRESAAGILRSWLGSHASVSLLVLWDESIPPDQINELRNWMAAIGWGGERCRWVSWQPVRRPVGQLRCLKGPSIRLTNRRLLLGLARWHGAQAHIWLSNWPNKPFETDLIPQGLAIIADQWSPPSRVQRLLANFKRPLLERRLHSYGAVSIDSASVLVQNLGKAADGWSSGPDLITRLLGLVEESGSGGTAASKSPQGRPRLAWVTPMPPEQTGIADYAELLVHDLSKHYEVMVITDAPPPKGRGKLWRRTAWLRSNGWRFDRICYHLGNSPFHRGIRDCLDLWPGAVVLHEFYLGDLEYSFEAWMGEPNQRWLRELYQTHGYRALIEARGPGQPHRHLRSFSCNGSILQRAFGVIVHSRHAEQLVEAQAGQESSLVVEQVPMVRGARTLPERNVARQSLGLGDGDVLICSFGMTGASKLSRELAEAWQEAVQQGGFQSRLVFVGGSSRDTYGADLEADLKEPRFGSRATITGWVDPQLYTSYLAACDIAVQLRTLSRGETSAAVLDCLCNGIATVVNHLGSLSELPEDSVLMLPAAPTHQDLVAALRELALNGKRRRAIAQRAAELQADHTPSLCANAYRESLGKIYAGQRSTEYQTIQGIGAALPAVGIDRINLSKTLARNFPRADGPRQLFVDVSQIARSDYKTGIQRVVRALILEFFQMGLEGYRVEPVLLSSAGGRWQYRYARRWTSQLLGLEAPELEDQPIEPSGGDVLFIADLTGGYLLESERCHILPGLIEQGVSIQAIVYDILPLQLPQYFPKGIDTGHRDWLSLLARRANTLHCISRAVASDVRAWLQSHQPEQLEHLAIEWFHLGADLENSNPTLGMPENLDQLTGRLGGRCTFLMVGTIEPRKGYAQVIGAFEQLLAEGHPFNLVILGKVGWMMEGLIQQLSTHPSFGNGIFWYESASDEFLRWLYQQCQCLITASEGEGFGLPLIEAALHSMPLLVRDLPVFQEVAGEGAMYFSGSTPQALAASVLDWHRRFKVGEHPNPGTITWQTWNQSARQLLEKMRLGEGA